MTKLIPAGNVYFQSQQKRINNNSANLKSQFKVYTLQLVAVTERF